MSCGISYCFTKSETGHALTGAFIISVYSHLNVCLRVRNPVSAPRQWLERFRQYTKRKHNKNNDKLIYPAPLQATSSKITESSWFRII